MKSRTFLFGLMVALYERPKTCWITIQGLFTLLVPVSTGSHLSLRMWFGGQPNGPLEGRRAADQVFTTPGLKTASMRTSVSDSENAKPHVIDQILLSSTVENMSALTFLLLYSFFSYILPFKCLGSEIYIFKKLLFLFKKDTLN